MNIELSANIVTDVTMTRWAENWWARQVASGITMFTMSRKTDASYRLAAMETLKLDMTAGSVVSNRSRAKPLMNATKARMVTDMNVVRARRLPRHDLLCASG